jgi:hypothetical protein
MEQNGLPSIIPEVASHSYLGNNFESKTEPIQLSFGKNKKLIILII